MTQALIERWNGAHWTIDATSGACGPECPGVAHALADIACASVSTCVAVGYRSTFQFTATFAQAWYGIGWATTPSTNLAGSGDSELTSVSCTTPTTESVPCPSASDCFAVGATRTETAATFPLSAPLLDRFK